ncbi:MAG: glycosyltransferase family 4 protein [Gammaproteobacteria bacterium]|nr:glycosyltransferase family 4 protein [Gammaproteobacteria bacterium]
MKIAFEASSISTYKPTGIANYGRSIIAELIDLCRDQDDFTLLHKISRYRKRNTLYRPNNINSSFYIPQLPHLSSKYDVIHSLDAYVPKWRNAVKISTIYDLFVLVSGEEKYFPKKFIQRKQKNYRTIKNTADYVITISETTKKDIVDKIGFPSDKVYVTPLGIASDFKTQTDDAIQFVKSKYRISGNYLFFVGNISSRKNVRRLIQAFHAGKFHKDFQLVLCGANSYHGDTALQEIDELKINSRVHVLDYADDQDLPALYSGASGFVFPTLYEGFGLPPLEAMACETPVLTSTTGAAPEVCGEHAVLVDPYSVDDIAAGIEKLLNVTPEKIAAAKYHAKQYTWRRCAEETLNVYRKVL